MEKTLIADLEADNLYDKVTKLHCLAIMNNETKEGVLYGPSDIRKGLERLYHADRVVFHNGAGYDVPVIQKFYTKFKCKLYDTLVMSRLLDPERRLHSIKSYGIQFGLHKVEHEDWSVYSDEMGQRCLRDIEIGGKVYDLVKAKAGAWDWTEARLMEQEIARMHLMQTVAGVTVDIEHTVKTVSDIDSDLLGIDIELNEKIPHHYVSAYSNPISLPFKKDGSFRANVTNWFDKGEIVCSY